MKISQNNHFFKKSMLNKWLINNKFYYISKEDFYNNGLIEIKELGSSRADTQFTSLLLNQETEKLIKTNDIENNFEKAANIYLHYNDFIHPNSKEENKDNIRILNIQNLLNLSVDYLSMQTIRNPKTLHTYFETFNQSLISNSPITQIGLLMGQKQKENIEKMIVLKFKELFDKLPNLYNDFFNNTKSNIGKPIELYMVTSEQNMFHLSEGNTTTLFKLLSECETLTWCNITQQRLNNIYITCLSPKLLLIINCDTQYCTDKEIEPIKNNIKDLWNSYIIKEALDKIILAENININEIARILNSPISEENKQIAEIFKRNESIYKKHHK